MPALAQAVAGGPGQVVFAVMAGAAACYVFMVLLPFYYRDRSASGRPDQREANLRTAAVVLFLVGVFLALFTATLRMTYGWAAASVMGIESAAYFLVATVALVAARRRGSRAPG